MSYYGMNVHVTRQGRDVVAYMTVRPTRVCEATTYVNVLLINATNTIASVTRARVR